MKLESLSFRDRFGILSEKRLSSVAELRYVMVYGKSQIGIIREYVLRGFSCFKRDNPMGERRKDALRVHFNRRF